ncbi:cytochrome b/b6 domain-containing protein, partial [Sphingomonas sp. TREG-RG-20F-R18-01]|uniref:cytochrome b n=1 Tax=Sphingomonas sp. TREG-RG-20F-R18-01 TaxID=2914982 RepID=UPI001F5954C9
MTNDQQERHRYSIVARALHWLTVALVVAQFGVAWTMPEIGRGTRPTGLVAWHLSIGTTILVVIVFRLLWRLTHHVPQPPNDLPPLLQLVSRSTHYLLYGLLLMLPLMGWANASSRGWPVKLFAVLPLPQLVPEESTFGHQLGDAHMTAATLLLVLIGLHVLGALYHLLVLRDQTVQRM